MERRGRNVAFDEQGRRVCSGMKERRECRRQPLKLHSRIGGACQLSPLGGKMEKRAGSTRAVAANACSGFGFDARDERIMTDGSIPVRNFILCWDGFARNGVLIYVRYVFQEFFNKNEQSYEARHLRSPSYVLFAPSGGCLSPVLPFACSARNDPPSRSFSQLMGLASPGGGGGHLSSPRCPPSQSSFNSAAQPSVALVACVCTGKKKSGVSSPPMETPGRETAVSIRGVRLYRLPVKR